ncbi:MAG: SDR family oxidoreductase [Candidatus Caldarchaeum sp.]|nr:SDR family oxidoreductase [Candidatus Caldarchaeum sp.]MDW8435071.1 SDR family NAD(P)-dependent oxidoreductase [Candidatus Caldarchaeum sp.]
MVSVVTGACGGIGAAVSRLFTSEGSRVVLVDLNEEAGKILEKEIRSSHGDGSCFFMKTDVSDEEDVKESLRQAVDRFGRVDVVVNNAAVHYIESIFDTTEETWRKTMDTNLKSVYLFCKHAARQMIEKSIQGSIVNVSSIQGIRGGVLSAAYAASKAGIIGLTKALAVELMPFGIRVNAVAPRAIDTPLFRRYLERRGLTDEDVKKRYLFGRLGKPEEVAAAVLFLASPESSYISGEVLVVGGDF